MIQRVISGWTIQRAIFTGIGLYVFIDSFLIKEWIGVVMGAYFSAMGIFGFGCAVGCANPPQKESEEMENKVEVEYEEVL